MWGLIIGSITVFVTIVFSMAKSSAKREEHAQNHQEELLNRKQAKSVDEQKKNQQHPRRKGNS